MSARVLIRIHTAPGLLHCMCKDSIRVGEAQQCDNAAHRTTSPTGKHRGPLVCYSPSLWSGVNHWFDSQRLLYLSTRRQRAMVLD
ncbi:hypothetical protein RRG08_063970 [Elysia crispata]|uniref:Uncharacterized protein n=1 Tax=Elysia crispata TaxID=231223 RepID=A0AAE0YF31_9GAST|nr:hypothetical protein RRG08_063970 [Elysia crispata]